MRWERLGIVEIRWEGVNHLQTSRECTIAVASGGKRKGKEKSGKVNGKEPTKKGENKISARERNRALIEKTEQGKIASRFVRGNSIGVTRTV